MSRLSTGIFGAVAICLGFGAIQFAFGHDLVASIPNVSPVGTSEAGINRAAKADRAPVAASTAQTRTIALRLESLADTSILIRLPMAQAGQNTPRGAGMPSLMKTGNGRPTEACEPMVSILTDVVKQLQPGRCVT
jgi:hypothetical protein